MTYELEKNEEEKLAQLNSDHPLDQVHLIVSHEASGYVEATVQEQVNSEAPNNAGHDLGVICIAHEKILGVLDSFSLKGVSGAILVKTVQDVLKGYPKP